MVWLDLDKIVILEGNDEYGNRYLTKFISDYKKIFPSDFINIGCESCLNNHYNKFIKYLKIMTQSKDTKTKAKLLKKYEGIQLKFGSKFFITNATMTNEQAIYLCEKHPHGKKLFQVLPEMKAKTDKQMTKKELIEKYPDIDAKLNIKEFLAAIDAAKETK